MTDHPPNRDVALLPVVLPSGREILIPAMNGEEAQSLGSQDGPAGFSDVAFHFEFTDIVNTATEIAGMLRKGIEHIRPRRATVELTIGVDAKTGQLTAFFVEGAANGALTIRLEWGDVQPELP